ncbi:SAM-dependent methyltransferase [Streptomyces sp. XD-27]|uniref:SAM-dependent methyltransferase n=1 Tax=Streptomyces sp. XD-27 TaxID=3062779 RepID=UPI0026F43B72|nr:SAM-dependent methyltransferase [Streptomyces sp. XD-27]WKX71018.1 SAM-dependent methyltransferase [Streptomyces sp. XD-27]
MTGYSFRADEIDTSRPHSARMYDYYLGGKTHYEIDAQAAESVMAAWPGVQQWARTNRAFMHRATRWLAAEAGIRQFLDLGTGIPTEPNLHQIAQGVVPDARIVYVDHDPIVLTYADALLNSTPEGRTVFLRADVAQPESILDSAVLRDTLDLTEPVGLSLNALMHFFPDEANPYGIVQHLLDALAPGSYLALSHGVPDPDSQVRDTVTELYRRSGMTVVGRTKNQVARFFDGLELIEPGVEMAHRWRPAPDTDPAELARTKVSLYVGVARKP